MSSFVDWIMSKNRSTKYYPKNMAEWYVKIRGEHPNLNIYAILSEITEKYRSARSFTPYQIERVNSLLKSIAHSCYGLSDYEVLLRFCADISYIAANSYREQVSQSNRKKFYTAALEGLNEGLGSFRHHAQLLQTTNRDEGMERHPALAAKRKKNTSKAREENAHSKQEEESADIYENMLRFTEEFERIRERIDYLFPSS